MHWIWAHACVRQTAGKQTPGSLGREPKTQLILASPVTR